MSRPFGVDNSVVRKVFSRVTVENVASNRRFRPCLGCLVGGSAEDSSVFSAYKAEDPGCGDACAIVDVESRGEFFLVDEDFPVYSPLLGSHLMADPQRAKITPSILSILDKVQETAEMPLDFFW